MSEEAERTVVETAASSAIRRSLVVPIYRNAENIQDLIVAVADMAKTLGDGFEVVFVVDGSPDNSGQLLIDAKKSLPCRSTVVFHSRNFGSFTAIRTGLELAEGQHIAAMAADLQEPPSLILRFFEMLDRDECDVVFGVRSERQDPLIRRTLSNVFWWAFRRMVIADIPQGGVDIFACNEQVRKTILEIQEPNSSLVAQLFWVGFRRGFVPYVRRARMRGTSAWNMSRRLRYMMDSIFSFSDLPILITLWTGVLGCVFSVILALITVAARLMGYIKDPGYTTILVMVVFLGSVSIAVQGIIGSYLWRAFENTKKRPLRILSRIVRD